MLFDSMPTLGRLYMTRQRIMAVAHPSGLHAVESLLGLDAWRPNASSDIKIAWPQMGDTQCLATSVRR